MRINWTRSVIWVPIGIAAFSSLFALAGPDPRSDIHNFHNVSPGIYRGGRPRAQGIEDLYLMGIKTDLNLEDDAESVREEKADAEYHGIKMISFPMTAHKWPVDADVEKILAILRDSSSYPIFVHCYHGEDRTGLIIGLHRVLNENWNPQRAWEEMLHLGYHTIFLPMNFYFWQKTKS